jgi:hypothetical protein
MRCYGHHYSLNLISSCLHQLISENVYQIEQISMWNYRFRQFLSLRISKSSSNQSDWFTSTTHTPQYSSRVSCQSIIQIVLAKNWWCWTSDKSVTIILTLKKSVCIYIYSEYKIRIWNHEMKVEWSDSQRVWKWERAWKTLTRIK